LTQALAHVLLATREDQLRVAWLGLDSSFSFDHLLADDVAEQVYGLRAPGTGPQIETDAISRRHPAWISPVRRVRQLAV
jgi:hypothetical protein